MSLFRLGEPSGNDLGSHNNISTRNLTASANLNSASRASYSRQRTDTLPAHARTDFLDNALSEAWKFLERRHCSICLETLDSSLWTRPSTLCTHEPKACEPCLAKYVMYAIKEGLTEIACPEVECRKVIEYDGIEIRVRGDKKCLNQYNALVAQKELERHPNFVWCTNARCGKGQIHNEGVTSPLMICHHCGTHTCFVHHVPWHKNVTCNQYSKHEEANKASEEYINTHMTRCPNMGCKRPIEKIDGCDHMTCHRPGGCGHEFCWICLADYGPIRREGNHKHNTDCRHFAGRPQSYENPMANILPRARELRRPRRYVCQGRTPLVAAPAIYREDDPPAQRRADTPIPPHPTNSPSPPPSPRPSPVRISPLNLLPGFYASPPTSLAPRRSFFRHFCGTVLPDSASSTLGPREDTPRAEASGSGHCHITNISNTPFIIRRPLSPTMGDNLSSRSLTPVPHPGPLPKNEARSSSQAEAHTLLPDFQEGNLVSGVLGRTRIARNSLLLLRMSNCGLPQRTEISCSSFAQPAEPQRSELYRPPPPPRVLRPASLAQPAPQLRYTQPRHSCLTSRARALARAAPRESTQGAQTREGLLRDDILRGSHLFQRGGEQQLSAIPDFESEVLLNFIGRR